jgi:L-alanine-DL-glutamate epimerase-like enolase superfamily enzyme
MRLLTNRTEVPLERIDVSLYKVPTDFPESDGTLEWLSTTVVVVEAYGGDERGIGYTYGSSAVAALIKDLLIDKVEGLDAMDVPRAWHEMVGAIRNQGRPGIGSMAIAAVDTALWDLKARLLGLPLVTLFGSVREGAPVYGSGGFTSYSLPQLQEQLSRWAEEGMTRVKMKIGRHPEADVLRVRAARVAIGPNIDLFVDANGAYTRKQALAMAEAFSEYGVTWFEEPVSSDDLEGLRLLRDRAPASMQISAGEYGYDLPYFRHMLDAGAVDVLQADATRCAGLSEWMRVGALCQARSMPFSSHTAPALHLPACCAVMPLIHMEYFHDHARIERMFFDGVPEPNRGILYPDSRRPGLGLEFKRSDAESYAI